MKLKDKVAKICPTAFGYRQGRNYCVWEKEGNKIGEHTRESWAWAEAYRFLTRISVCDLCGEYFKGERHTLYSENFVPQRVYHCGCAFNN